MQIFWSARINELLNENKAKRLGQPLGDWSLESFEISTQNNWKIKIVEQDHPKSDWKFVVIVTIRKTI